VASVVRVRHPERSDDDLQHTLCGDTTVGSVATNPHPIAPAWVVQSYPTFKQFVMVDGRTSRPRPTQ